LISIKEAKRNEGTKLMSSKEPRIRLQPMRKKGNKLLRWLLRKRKARLVAKRIQKKRKKRRKKRSLLFH
jgi:hypothetical protein